MLPPQLLGHQIVYRLYRIIYRIKKILVSLLCVFVPYKKNRRLIRNHFGFGLSGTSKPVELFEAGCLNKFVKLYFLYYQRKLVEAQTNDNKENTASNNAIENRILKQEYLFKIFQNAMIHGFYGPVSSLPSFPKGSNAVLYYGNHPYLDVAKKMLSILKPMKAVGKSKCRIGQKSDGGYVMLDPGADGIAYSFGIGNNVSWDFEMSKRNFEVFQYDGSINSPPITEPRLHFYKYNITGSVSAKLGHKSLSEIISDLGHENVSDMILKMDIEGSEWDVLLNTPEHILSKFDQMIIEFHDVTDFRPEAANTHLKAFEKLNMTHQSVHYHINNCGNIAVFPEFNIGCSSEVTFLRRDGNTFVPDFSEYPTEFDSPNNISRPDIYIGNLESLLT